VSITPPLQVAASTFPGAGGHDGGMPHGRHVAPRAPGWVAVAGLLAALTALLLAGCSHGSPANASATTPAALVIRQATATPSATPTPSPTPSLPADVKEPTAGRWIEVDVTHYVVRLMEGRKVIEQIGPVAVGAQIDTGAYESTQTGLFHVYNKIAPLSYDAPYKTYIQWWVGFDPDKANGFHSFLEDEHGKVVDGSTGNVSNGCIRTPDPQALFDFAEVGMPVLVHS
jgi:lipoprotein-anchoring transpeptidase ErfK/SrfK